MANGDGSIIAKGRGVWEVQVSFGRNPVTGRYERATRTVHGTKKDAAKVRDELRRQHESGVKADGAKMRFGELAEEWRSIREEDEGLSKSTKCLDRICCELLIKHLGDMRLCDITPAVIERLYRDIKSGRISKSGKPLKGNSAIKYHQRLHMIMDRAVMHDLIARNPCDRVKAPSVNKSERGHLTAEGCAALVGTLDSGLEAAYRSYREKEERNAAAENRASLDGVVGISRLVAVRIALDTGMRRGEVLALTWGDVDIKRASINVRHSNADGVVKDTKTASSIRTISFDSGLAAVLEEWRGFELAEMRKLKTERRAAETPVVVSATGGFTHPANFSAWWRRWREENGFSGLKLHELRHTQATLLLANGTDVKTVQARLGHANAAMTLNMYAHSLPECDRAAADLFGSIVESGKGNVVSMKAAS